MPQANEFRVCRSDSHFCAAVVVVLAIDSCQRRPGNVMETYRGVQKEPITGLAQTPVELVVLAEHCVRIEMANPVEYVAAIGSALDGVHELAATLSGILAP